jgi:DNA-binding CsgD family transcriptional regulator
VLRSKWAGGVGLKPNLLDKENAAWCSFETSRYPCWNGVGWAFRRKGLQANRSPSGALSDTPQFELRAGQRLRRRSDQHLKSFESMAISRSLPNLAMSAPLSTQRLQTGLKALEALAGTEPASHLPTSDQGRPYHLLVAGFEALDLVNIGLLVTSASGQLLLANRTADLILKTRDGLELTPAGAVRTSMKCTPSLSALMETGAKTEAAGSKDSVLPLRRPSGKRPLTAVVRAVEGACGNTDPMAPAILLFILDPEIPVERVETELRQLYGLTSMEARLANLLMEGKALDECCTVLGIRRSTARTHLQHLFEKVGVQRQSELVSLLLKSIGLVGTGNKAASHPTAVQRSNR